MSGAGRSEWTGEERWAVGFVDERSGRPGGLADALQVVVRKKRGQAPNPG